MAQVMLQPQQHVTSKTWYRTLPVVSFPSDPKAEAFINADLASELGGATFVDVAAMPAGEPAMFGDMRTKCSVSIRTSTVIGFVCESRWMGAHPFEQTLGLAYDSRPEKTRRLNARDIFTDVGATQLAAVVAMRAQMSVALSRGSTEVLAPRIDPLELYAGLIEVTYDRCSLGACIYHGTVVTLMCAEVTPHLRSDSPWRCAE